MSSCTPAILARIGGADSFNAWKGMTSSQVNSISPTAAGGTIPPTTLEASTLATAAADIFTTTACIQEQLTGLGGTTNQIQLAQQSILSIQEQIEAAEADVAIARDRVAYIRHPEEHTSYYESWFPIDRPMHSNSVPYFVGVTIFLIIFSLLVGLSALGLNITVNIHPAFLAFIDFVISQFTYLTMSLTLLVAFGIYYFISQKQS